MSDHAKVLIAGAASIAALLTGVWISAVQPMLQARLRARRRGGYWI